MANSGVTQTLKIIVFDEANGICEYCRHQQRYSTGSFSADHIFPFSKGGSNERINLACSCPFCNSHKFTKTTGLDPVTRRSYPLFNPRTQIWTEHFTWDETFTEVMGLTPIGRCTITALNMNREESVNLRMVLVAFGVHPPS
jgi:hypothetical protein